VCVNLYNFKIDAGAEGRVFERFSFWFDGQKIEDGPSCVISARKAGCMGLCAEAPASPSSNRRALFAALGVDEKKVYFAKQIHSKNVIFVDENAPNFTDGADGFVSPPAGAGAGVFLAVTAADCLPVMLLDVKTGAFAAVHSGWKGTGIARRALNLMTQKCGSRPQDVAAVLGPCICGLCYQVDKSRFMAFNAEFGDIPRPFRVCGDVVHSVKNDEKEMFFIDIRAANAAMLAYSGVRNIAVCENCTYTDENLGSFRREGAGAYTKMLAVCGRF
jgi:YfiH family protein